MRLYSPQSNTCRTRGESTMQCRMRILTLAATSLIVAACGSEGPAGNPPAAPGRPATAPSAAVPVGLVLATLEVPKDEWRANTLAEPRQVLIPPGWTMSVWASQMSAPRLIASAPDGAMLVSQPAAGKVARLIPSPDGTATVTTLLEGLDEPHGIAFQGDTLLVAETNQLVAYGYDDGMVTGQRVIVPDLPNQASKDLKGKYEHRLKSVAVGFDGAIYFSIGSTGNVTSEDRSATPPKATIMRIPPGVGVRGEYEVFATGVRNGTGLAIAPDGALWTAVNNRDEITYPYDKPYGAAPTSSMGQIIQDYVNNHPPELLARIFPGRELGWPYCNADGDLDPGVVNSPQRTTYVPFTRDWASNRDGANMDCASLEPVEQTIAAHSAPLGLSFVDGELPAPYHRGALVGVHGSWNAVPPRAPEVSFFQSQGSGLAPQRTLVGGFQDLAGNRWGRPVAAAVGPDGAVYITDDVSGSVCRLAPSG